MFGNTNLLTYEITASHFYNPIFAFIGNGLTIAESGISLFLLQLLRGAARAVRCTFFFLA